MNRVFIHCGAPKTGTSYLQVLFARYSDQLAEAGILYPEDVPVDEARKGAITSGNGIGMANYLRPSLPHNLPYKDSWIEKFRNTLSLAKGKDLLYSSEFIVFPDNQRSEILRNAIADAGYKPHCIFFVRDLAVAARSVYSQEVKRAGETRNFMDFLKNWDPLYLHFISRVSETFGKESLHLFNYEQHADTLARFFFKEILETDFEIEDRFTINRSLTDKEIELLRLMNSHFPKGQSHYSTFVSDALMTLPREQEEFAVTKNEMEYLWQRFSSKMHVINDHITGCKIRIARTVVPEKSTIELGDFEKATIAILAKLVVHRR